MRRTQDDQGQSDEDKAQEQGKKDSEWNERDLRLKAVHAEGPCPYVKVLYGRRPLPGIQGRQGSDLGGRMDRRDQRHFVGLRLQGHRADPGRHGRQLLAGPRADG
ncbi:MAG: hypothetical protein WDN06_09890 [Asticcacaulis sp.]